MKQNNLVIAVIALVVGALAAYLVMNGQKTEVVEEVAVETAVESNKVNIRVQAVIGTQTTEVKMLRDFMDDVTALTGGDVTFEVLPAGAVVGGVV